MFDSKCPTLMSSELICSWLLVLSSCIDCKHNLEQMQALMLRASTPLFGLVGVEGSHGSYAMQN